MSFTYKKLFLSLIFLAGCLAGQQASAATATGTFESSIIAVGENMKFETISWTATVPASSTLAIRVRTATTADMAGASAWSSCSPVTNNTDIGTSSCVTTGQAYIQYQAAFSTVYNSTSTYAAPILNDVAISYQPIGVLISSPYDTSASDTIVKAVRWGQSLTGGGLVKVQLRTSADGTNWSSWLGAGGANTYYTISGGTQPIYVSSSDGVNDQWLQYRILLDALGASQVTLNDITVDYEANMPIIDSLTPDNVQDNASTTTIRLDGSGLTSGSIVKMISQGKVIFATNVTLVTPELLGAPYLTANLDLTAAFGGRADVFVVNPNGSMSTKPFWIKRQVGVFTSAIHNFGLKPTYGNVAWSEQVSPTSTLIMKVRSANESNMSGATDWSLCPAVANNSDLTTDTCVVNGQQYLQYQVTLATDYSDEYQATTSFASAFFHDFSLAYNYYQGGSFISAPYDSTDDGNVVSSLTWSGQQPSGTLIKLQLRTAADNGGVPGAWSGWNGPLGAGTYYIDALGGEAVYGQSIDDGTHRWFQYQVFLDSDGLDSPLLSDINLAYQHRLTVRVKVNDLISRSWPAATSSHYIKFVAQHAVPPGGRIIITPQADVFTIEPGFNFSDAQLSYAPDFNGPFDLQTLSNVSGPNVNAFLALPTKFLILLSTNRGILAGESVAVRLGWLDGGRYITNPSTVGSYKMFYETQLPNQQKIDSGETMIAVVEKVAVSAQTPKIRFNGRPVGFLAANTTMTQLYFKTNYIATCRYSTASNTPFDSMVNEVPMINNFEYQTTIGGFINGTDYFYYIRCKEIATGVADEDDYVIAFSTMHGGGAGGTGGGAGGGSGETTGTGTSTVASTTATSTTPGSGTVASSTTGGDGGGSGTGTSTDTGTGVSGTGGGGGSGTGSTTGSGTGGGGTGSGGGTGDDTGTGAPGRGSGGGGGGSGGGTGSSQGSSLAGGGGGGTGFDGSASTETGESKLFPPAKAKPVLLLSGWAAPNAQVTLLKDGVQIMKNAADKSAIFSMTTSELIEGVYTFGIFDNDTEGRKSSTFSATFALRQDSKTELNKIIVPPTISLSKTDLQPGETLSAFGQTVPGATIEGLFAQIQAKGTSTKKQVAVGVDGKWRLDLETKGLPNGQYTFKTRVLIKNVGFSDYSQVFQVGLGEKVTTGVGVCQGSDLNRDGRVNLPDFSILLYYWGTNNACADQNHDGKVNLIDFSIMLYNWTG